MKGRMTLSRRRAAVVGAVLVTGSMIAAAPASAATPTPYGVNLARNAGAEEGSASADGTETVPVPRWETFAGATVVGYGESGFPDQGEGSRIGGGQQFFSAGLWDASLGACGDFRETIKLKGRSALIDGAHIKVRFRGWVAASGPAIAHLDLAFRDAENHQVAINGITNTVEDTGGEFMKYQRGSVLPNRARLLNIHLWAENTQEDGYCEAYFDGIEVRIKYVP